MCLKNTTLIVQTKRISTLLTIFQIAGFLPFLHFLLEQHRDTCTIRIFYMILLTHYTVNNILYHGKKLKAGRQICIDTWLFCYAIEFTGLFVFSVYSAYSALTWSARGWPNYYRKSADNICNFVNCSSDSCRLLGFRFEMLHIYQQ